MDVRRLVDEMVMLLITYRPMAHAATWALFELARAPEVHAALEERRSPMRKRRPETARVRESLRHHASERARSGSIAAR